MDCFFNYTFSTALALQWFVNDAFERMWKKQMWPISGVIQAFAGNDIQKL
jgi:hypothetical protein